MSGHRLHAIPLVGLLLGMGVPSWAGAASLTDQLKWAPGQAPAGQTNGPDGLDDIWQGRFNAWALDPDGDNDNDGSKNIVESIAGTSPFLSTDSFKIGNMTVSALAVVFSTKVEAGKKYRVLGAEGLGQVTWEPETLQTPLAGVQEYIPSADAAEVFLSIQRPVGDKKFYKLETSDVDSNGDGVSDWVARKLGLNPELTDSNGDGISDAAAILQELTTQDTVTLSADNAFASEDGGPPGMLRLRRGRSLLGATIFYTVGGTAGAGVDFAPLTGSVYFAPGATEAYIAIAPNADASLEGGESVTVTLTGGMTSSSTPLEISGSNQASVIISNTTAATGTGLLGRYYDTASSTYAHGVNFGDIGSYVYTRSGTSPNFTGTVVIPYSKTPAVKVGDVVRVTFTGGNLNTATYNHLDYTVAAVSPATSFTLNLAGAALPATSSSTCNFSFQSIPHPAVIERVDATVDQEWMGGTPGGVAVAVPSTLENYSDTFEMYLSPAAAGSYRFQLDADDKARVLLDLNDGNGLQEIVEHGWDATPDTVGVFKISAAFTLAVPSTPAQRYRMRVQHVQSAGQARCRLQWSRNSGAFANIPQAEQFTHTQAATYTFSRTSATAGTATITLASHGLVNGSSVRIAFAAHNLFSQNAADPAGYSGTFTVANASSHVFTVPISGSSLPDDVFGGAACFIEERPASTTTGVYNKVYLNSTFTGAPARVGVDTAVTFTNNGIWGGGTPNGVVVTQYRTTENYSDTFETYLSPAAAGSYRFQLDADDKARVLLDLNDGNGLQEILEHGWDATADTVGAFKISSPVTLAVPAGAGGRYRMRVEHVETTNEARCRLQWSRDGGTFANIPQAEQFTHTQAATYTFTQTTATTGTATITLNGHGLTNNTPVAIAFSSGNLFTPNIYDPAGYSGTFTVANATTNTFTVPVTGTNLPANVTSATACFLEDRPLSTTTGVYNKVYSNTSFTGAPGRVGVDTAVTASNNGLWGTGTPDVNLIHPDTFSIRWSGQIQPQFTEDYTLVVHADDGATLKINGQLQPLKPHVASNQGGSTYVYDSTSGNSVVTYTNSILQLNSFVVGETVRLDPSGGNLNYSGGATYDYNSVSGNMVVTYSGIATISPGGFLVGQTVFLDPTNGNLTALASLPYVITAADSTTFTVSVGAGLFATGTGSLNISDTMDYEVLAVTSNSFTVHVGKDRHPNGSSGSINIEMVNKLIKDWSSFGNERYVRLPMIGGVRYDIELDYWENTGFSRCRLFWYSPSQPRQIIPTERLYPANAPLAPPAHVSNTTTVALIGGQVSIPVAGSNGASVSVSGAPAWLTYSGGVLSGTPPAGSAGTYQILITLTDAEGTTTSLLNLRVDDTGAAIVREQWDGVTGTSIASIPTGSTPSSTSTLSTLQGPTDVGEDFGSRTRGYITTPVTGNYYFWIAASHTAELWISNDDEPVNAFKRAWVTNGTAPEEWSKAGELHQKSPWLALEEGKRYYIEILHKSSTGSDHLAIGWLTPGQGGAVPSQIVPGFVLSPYVAPAAGSTPGTLYVASMLSQNGALTSGVGTSTLRLSEDESTAIVNFSYGGLTGVMTDWHVHVDPYLTHQSMIVYDGVEPVNPNDGPRPDGSHHWTIEPVGTLSKAEIVEIIKQGKAYINLHTAAYPAGEIRGNYTLAAGSRVFSPPPPPATWADDSGTDSAAVRFLTQATYGAGIEDINALQAFPAGGGKTRYERWIEDQFTKGPNHHLDEVLRTENASAQGSAFDEQLSFNAWWWRSVTGDDQLRQRMAFALSEILVVSGQGPLENNALSLSYFYDQLLDHSFGNFRDVLEAVTLTPTMGRYLDMLRNDKPDQTVGRIPNENYAREIKQLFSVGLFRMWPDGTLMLTSRDAPIDVYTQREIIGFAHVFTGWDYGYNGAYRTTLGATADWTRQMREVPARHFIGPKRLLNNEVLPGISSAGGQPLDPYAVHNTTHFSAAAYQSLPAQELDVAHDQLFSHPNVGPFICRQLIQRLVTSSPSRDYLYRVVQKFNDNGAGVRGDMQAVIKAILLDYEARSPDMIPKPAFGKQREPVLRVTAPARAFRQEAFSGSYTQTGTSTITVTTTAPHKFANGNLFLNFTSGAPAPWTGSYSATVTGSNTLTVTAQGWAASITNGYVIPANSTVCTVTMNNHWLQTGHKIFVDFTSGPANGVSGLDGQIYTLTSASAESGNNGTFTFTIPAGQVSASARTGNCMVPRFSPGSYTTAASGLAAPQDRRVTMDTNFSHELNVGDQVQINFYGGNPQPSDMVVTVDTVVDSNTWTFLAPAAGTNLGTSQGFDQVYQFPLKSLPLTRSGSVGSRPSTFRMDNTDTDLSQSPLNSPTVFNFFLPDYKFPGSLASQGITTPEFQMTAETTAVRQANFFYNGLFTSGATNGITSFKSGGNALVLDFSPWMGAGPVADLGLGAPANTAVPWTSNQNLDVLINHLSILLLADQLSPQAKAIIRNFVATPIASIEVASPCRVNTSVPHKLNTGDTVLVSGVTNGTFSATLNSTTTTRTVTVVDADTFTLTSVNCTVAPNASGLTNAHVSVVPYNSGGTPTDTHKRDRLRAIIHLILSSPDFTIQR